MARILEQIVASLDDNTKEAIVNYRSGNRPEDVAYLSGEWAEGVILIHVLEALRFCWRVIADSMGVDAKAVAGRLNENPCFFFGTKKSMTRSGHADSDLWQFGCFPCSPVAG